MFRARIVVAALLLLPGALIAQGGRKGKMGSGGEKSADWDDMKKTTAAGMQLSNKDVEGTSMVKVLIDKRKDLKLSDDVVKQLKDMDAADKDKNKPLFKTLDSLRGETKPSGVEPNDADRIRAQMATSMAETVVKSIRANYGVSLQSALALMDDTQKTAANELVVKETTEADEMLREKLSGRGGGPPGGDGGAQRSRGRRG